MPTADVEELEMLLSVDGGRHYALRITPEIDARNRSFRWRIPYAPTELARLRIRYGREHDEALGEPSGEFSIRPGRSDSNARSNPPVQDVRMVHESGGWAPTDAEPPPPCGRNLESSGTALSIGVEPTSASETRRPQLNAASMGFTRADRPERSAAAQAPIPASSIALRFLPLRE